MNIYVIRHGQTDWNLQGLTQGKTDIPLNETGRAQACETRELLKDIPLDRVISSPLGRALETAGLATAGRGLPLETDPRLMERGFGSFEGGPRNALPSEQLWGLDGESGIGGAEPLEALLDRVYACLREIIRRCPGENVLLVTHGGTCRAIESFFHQENAAAVLREFRIANAQIRHYETEQLPD